MPPSKGGKGKGKDASGGGDKKEAGQLKVANALKLRHILCEKQSKHLEALEKIKEGVSFDKVATEYSEDKARQGGSLGWVIRTSMIGAFQDVMFDVPPSTCASPDYRCIKSKFGYHIAMVEDRK
ncbi:peptidylprolyl isomerase [Sporobolomyces salmoneus]|uniref:peptidylprolyl isomerase n=1 Tax=Sporobolomyces salmoneus TaxID=183962 RepID=UPI00317949DC